MQLPNYSDRHIRPRIFCADGTSLSVQASEYHYCTPRENGLDDYCAVEVGYLRDAQGNAVPAPESWLPFSDDGGLSSSVFGYVPSELVKQFIADHGGYANQKP